MENNLEQQIFETRRRNLRIILTLSIIGSGLYFISYLMTGLTLPALKAMYQSGSISFPPETTVLVEQFFETPRSFFLCSALLYAASLTGVILMWNLRKSGFHLYTLAQLLVMLVTLLFLGRERLPLGDIMFTLLFIVYYYIALRNLGVFSRTVANDTGESGNDNNEDDNNESGNNESGNSENGNNENENSYRAIADSDDRQPQDDLHQ